MNKKDQLADKRLRRTYGITLEEYDSMLARQGYVCKICKRPPREGLRLCVDHDHRFDRVKIRVFKPDGLGGRWEAECMYKSWVGAERKEARLKLRLWLRRQGIRGLLCNGCNRALGKVQDPRWKWFSTEMRAGADYLDEFQKGNLIDTPWPKI